MAAQYLELHAAGARLQCALTMLYERGVGGGAKEAITFAFYAMYTVPGRPLVVPQRFETRIRTIVGSASLGRNYGEIMRKNVAFRGNLESDYLPPAQQTTLQT